MSEPMNQKILLARTVKHRIQAVELLETALHLGTEAGPRFAGPSDLVPTTAAREALRDAEFAGAEAAMTALAALYA